MRYSVFGRGPNLSKLPISTSRAEGCVDEIANARMGACDDLARKRWTGGSPDGNQFFENQIEGKAVLTQKDKRILAETESRVNPLAWRQRERRWKYSRRSVLEEFSFAPKISMQRHEVTNDVIVLKSTLYTD